VIKAEKAVDATGRLSDLSSRSGGLTAENLEDPIIQSAPQEPALILV
jgi:hypothetical protein